MTSEEFGPQASPEREKNIRLFTAVALPESVKSEISACMKKLQTGAQFTGAHPAWVKPEGVHITLVFIGWVDPGSADALKACMDGAAKGATPLNLRIGGIELFPNPRNPRVIAMNMRGDVQQLASVYDRLAANCRDAGFDVETRPFRPHLTLARIKSPKGLTGLRDVVDMHRNEQAGEVPVDRITLYQSFLRPEGAEYKVVYEAKLGG